MSQWVRLRNMGAAIAPAIYAMLGKCRSLARQRNQAASLERAGQGLKAQHLNHRLREGVSAPITLAERKARVKELLAERSAKNAARASKEAPDSFELNPAPPKAPGRLKAEDLGGRTPFMFDMKKGDLKGQASIFDKVATVHTHEGTKKEAQAQAPKPPKAKPVKLRPAEEAPLHLRIGAEAEALSQGWGRAYIRDLRAKFPGVSREEFDAALHKATQETNVQAYGSDSPTETAEHDRHAIRTPLGKALHVVYAGGRSVDGRANPADALQRWRETPAKSVATLAGAPSKGGPVLKAVKDAPPSPAAIRKADAGGRSKLAGKVKTYRAAELEHKAPERFGKTGGTYEFDAAKVHFDPDRFQYKLAAQGSHGTTDALGDVRKWDPELAGSLSLWRDPADGRVFVVNGHHRLDLAKRLGVGKVTGKLIDAPDAVTARAKGALVNIAEGRGTATDAAKFFRDTGITAEALKGRGVSLREHTATAGLAMAGLSDRGFRRLVDGGLTPARAAIVGGSGLSHEQQDALLRVLDKPRNAKLTDGTVRNMAEEARAAGSRSKATRDLFGASEEEEALFVHRARAAEKIGRELAADKKLFGLVSKSKAAEKLAERGRSTIDREKTGQVSAESAAVLGLFAQLKNRHPGVSRELNRAAAAIADGRPEKEVMRETRSKLSEVLRRILSGEDDPFA